MSELTDRLKRAMPRQGVLAWSYLPPPDGEEFHPPVEVECHEAPPVGRLEFEFPPDVDTSAFRLTPYHDPKFEVKP